MKFSLECGGSHRRHLVKLVLMGAASSVLIPCRSSIIYRVSISVGYVAVSLDEIGKVVLDLW